MPAPISPQPVYRRSASTVRTALETDISEVLRTLFEKYVLEEARSLGAASGMPDKWIDGLDMEEAGWNEFHLVNTFKGKFGEPLAQIFEEGTKQNYPITPKVEHEDLSQYQDRDLAEIIHGDKTTHQHPPMLAWFRDGRWHFRRRVIHPGQPGSWAMRRAIEIGVPKVQEGLQWWIAKHPEYAEFDVGLQIELVEGAGA